MTITVLMILAAIFAVVATVLAFIFVVPASKRNSFGEFGRFLHDTVNFKYLIVEKILQALYIFATAYVILQGFFMLFYVDNSYSYYYSTSTWYGGYGILLMILGPIAVRLVYELLMMTILLIKNVIEINSKLKSDNEGGTADIFAMPVVEKAPAPTPVPTPTPAPVAQPPKAMFCTKCGTPLNENGICPNCTLENPV